MKAYREVVVLTPGELVVEVCDDPDDDKFLACAVEAQAAYIISGDKKHLLSLGSFEEIPIISPKDFIEMVMQK